MLFSPLSVWLLSVTEDWLFPRVLGDPCSAQQHCQMKFCGMPSCPRHDSNFRAEEAIWPLHQRKKSLQLTMFSFGAYQNTHSTLQSGIFSPELCSLFFTHLVSLHLSEHPEIQHFKKQPKGTDIYIFCCRVLDYKSLTKDRQRMSEIKQAK